jgi:hypothetical protein
MAVSTSDRESGNGKLSVKRLNGGSTMPEHAWTKVDAGVFHDFHTAWIIHLRDRLNDSLLPEGYYALAEQHAGRWIPDILTLHDSPPGISSMVPTPSGGLAVADAPPRARKKLVAWGSARAKRRTLAIRHVSGHRLIALLEIVSPANKDRRDHVQEFAGKVTAALEQGVHVLVVDLFAPAANDPLGMHGAIWSMLDEEGATYEIPEDEPLTFASYVAGPPIEVFLDHASIGAALPQMPLFLFGETYINVPLEATYEAAFRGTPRYWRDILVRG